MPTYFFVVSIALLLAAGLYRYLTGGIVPVDVPLPPNAGQQPLTTFLLLTAFANGCTAMTGVEAVSNGVPAFRPPEAKNASATLVAMATLAIVMFVGITVLAHAYKVVPNSAESGISQLGRAIFGGPNILYYLLQAGTTLILVLAANTAYADFPRLASIVSRDRYLPRQFMNQGDRLAFSNGILVLSLFAAILIVAFRGDTQSLLPLYMIGVFVSFTLSQAGMVIHWRKTQGAGLEDQRDDQRLRRAGDRHRPDHRRRHQDARRRVDRAAADPDRSSRCSRRRTATTITSASELTLRGYEPQRRVHNTVLIPIGGLQRAVVEALRYAETLSDDVRAIYVDVNPAQTEQLRKDWAAWGGRVKLVVLPSPFRSLMEPLLEYIEQAAAEKSERLRHGHPAGIRAGALVAASAPQPDVAAHQGRAAVPAEHRRHQRAVPSVEIDGAASFAPTARRCRDPRAKCRSPIRRPSAGGFPSVHTYADRRRSACKRQNAPPGSRRRWVSLATRSTASGSMATITVDSAPSAMCLTTKGMLWR